MSRATTAAFAATVLAASVLTGGAASAAPAQDPAVPVECSSLSALPALGGLGVVDPACALLEQLGGILAPAEQPVVEPLAPVLGPVAPAPEASPAGPSSSAGPAGPSSPATAPSNTQATSSGSATAADLGSEPALSAGYALPRSSTSSSSARVPAVPVGSELHLAPLALPTFSLSSPATASEAAASNDTVAEDIVLPAAQAAASLPDDSKTTAVVMAISTLLLAAGLLLDQMRKARQPIQL